MTMSLTRPEVPPEILRAFTSELGNYLDSRDPLWSLLLNKYVAIDVYALVLSEFAQIQQADYGRILTFRGPILKDSGWLFLAAEGGLWGGCHVGSIEENHPPKLTGFSRSPRILTGLERSNQLEAVVSGNYLVHIVRIPWLHFDVFWLFNKDRVGDALVPDLVVPYDGFVENSHDDAEHALELLEPYPISTFLTKISPRADAVLTQTFEIEAVGLEARARRLDAQARGQADGLRALEAQSKALRERAEKAARDAAYRRGRGPGPDK
jgi:hypothetical protein